MGPARRAALSIRSSMLTLPLIMPWLFHVLAKPLLIRSVRVFSCLGAIAWWWSAHERDARASSGHLLMHERSIALVQVPNQWLVCRQRDSVCDRSLTCVVIELQSLAAWGH